MSELKQRLKRRGEQGSPCRTPLLTMIGSVSWPLDETVIPKHCVYTVKYPDEGLWNMMVSEARSYEVVMDLTKGIPQVQ